MVDANRTDREPTVEEILASIKRVMAEDNRAETRNSRSASRPVALRPAVAPPSADTLEPFVEDAQDEEDVLELTDNVEAEEPVATVPDLLATQSPLIAEKTRNATREAFAALRAAEPKSEAPLPSGETSLEGLAREMLRPMLAQWLDAHLPGIVERIVTDEVRRLSED